MLAMIYTSVCSLMFHGPGLSENLSEWGRVMDRIRHAKGVGRADGMQEGGR
jgi:hypothetical protein